MRLWHEALIPHLPQQQLLGQHRECCALRGKGWGKNHSTVNYVFQYSPYHLYCYHRKVMEEMKKRNYNIDPLWMDPFYRGKKCEAHDKTSLYQNMEDFKDVCYREHDRAYLKVCLENLAEKGVTINHPF
ncbi:uncharacterized protein (TIGR02328 family) [Geomicrobium halophilum]|uniref:Uncharacterized protein (TIGR02328 family) n=1 Tax=Geomicrobium halophilum TaxID=549000 RepID=A0A841PYV6_9BACL|nr:TIGR02328 family protein [Geomicrobium halophilum]MBB6449642.1 uncharacterized protein (TIGR02328 family) [Geomicrobium halophilum]